MGLICVAVALPVALFLERAFEIANEVEGATEGWMTFNGKWRLLLGRHAHADWHWTDPKRKPPSELVQWLAQNDNPGWGETLAFFIPWGLKTLLNMILRRDEPEENLDAEGDGDEQASEAGSAKLVAEARAAALVRRLYAAAGLLGVYVAWAIMSWFIFTCACSWQPLHLQPCSNSPLLPIPQTG